MAFKSLTGFDASGQRIVSIADPSSASDAVTKSYVDNLLAGLRWKAPVRAASTTNMTLATAVENTDVMDGVTLATGDRILLKNQTAATENGIYTVNVTGAPTRATDADSTAELNGAAVLVTTGTVNADLAFVQVTDSPVIATNNIVWNQFGGGGNSYLAGNGLGLSSQTFSVTANGTSIDVSSSGVKIADAAAGSGLGVAAGVLAVNTGTASATGLEVSGDNVRIATDAAGTGLTGGGGAALAVNTSVVVRKYAVDVGDNSSTSIAITHGLGTKDVTWSLYQKSNDTDVYCDAVRTSTSVLTLTFATAPTTNQFRVVVHA